MPDEKKTYLVNVESNLAEYSDAAAAAKKKVDELKVSNEELKKSGATPAEIEASNAALRNAQKEYTQAKKMVDLQTAANLANTNSRKQLGAIVELEQKRLGALANQYAINDKGQRVLSQDYQETSKRLKDAKDAIILYDKAQSDGRSSIGLYSEAIEGALGKVSMLPGAMGQAGTAVKTFATTLKAAFASNPILLAITLIVGAIAGLIAIFKKFDPVVEKFQQIMGGIKAVFTGLKEGIIGLVTGQKTLAESFHGLGRAIKSAYDEGVKLKGLEQELENMKALETVSNAKATRQINELLLASKNRTKSEEERQMLIGQALLLEEVQYNDRKIIAEKELEIQLGKITQGKKFTEEEINEIKKRGVAYLLEVQKRKSVSDDEVLAYANAEANKENILNESIAIREKAMNRADLLEQQSEAKRQKRTDDEQKRIDKKKKSEDDAMKRFADAIQKEIDLMDKQAESEWQFGLELGKKLFDQNRENAQRIWDAEEADREKKKVADAKAEDVKRAIFDAGVQAMQTAADTIFQIKQNRLNQEMAAELSNTKLTEAQKSAIRKKYAKEQQRLAIMQAIVQGALGFVSSLAGPPIYKWIEAAAVLVATAAQIALIKSQSVDGGGGSSSTGSTTAPAPARTIAATVPVEIIATSTPTGITPAPASTPANITSTPESTPSTTKITSTTTTTKITTTPAPTGITTTPEARTAFTTPKGSTILTQPQMAKQQLNAMPSENLLTAKDIAYEMSKLPPPIVTVEDINAKVKSVKKIEVRANI